jgi:signal transduction histidine kinase
MKFGILRKKARSNRNKFLKVYFISGSAIIILFFLFYTNTLLENIRNDIQVIPDLYSKFIGLPDNVNLEDFLSQYVITEIIPRIDYPIILTDSLKVPFSWENLSLEQKSFIDLELKDQNFLMKQMRKMEKRKSVIPLRINLESDKIHGYVYFGETKTMTQLKMMPYLELSLILLFVFLGIYGLLYVKRNERDLLWVGLAKETAHQFGTPISSLLGWIDVIKTRLDLNDSETLEMLEFMQTDIKRLKKVASRFGKVGSTISKQPTDLHTIITKTVTYFNRKLPGGAKAINIEFNSEIQNKTVHIDVDLIQWTIENLFKNSIDAMQDRTGKIEVSATARNKKILLKFKDQGMGIPKNMFKKIFLPGISNKERGWGLGLSLAKRIIEEFHRGKIFVSDSKVGIGTTIDIILPEE